MQPISLVMGQSTVMGGLPILLVDMVIYVNLSKTFLLETLGEKGKQQNKDKEPQKYTKK